jgi:hypothetical protein
MGHGRRLSPVLWLGGSACAWALTGHHVAYMLMSHDVMRGGGLPVTTSLRHFGWYSALALGMVMAALAWFFRSRVNSGDRGQHSALLALHFAVRLVPLQIAACLLIHAAEGFLVAGELGGLLAESQVIVAIVTQTTAAVCAAVVLAALASVADLVALRGGGPRPRRTRSISAIFPHVQVALAPAVAVLAGTISHRGPPRFNPYL